MQSAVNYKQINDRKIIFLGKSPCPLKIKNTLKRAMIASIKGLTNLNELNEKRNFVRPVRTKNNVRCAAVSDFNTFLFVYSSDGTYPEESTTNI